MLWNLSVVLNSVTAKTSTVVSTFHQEKTQLHNFFPARADSHAYFPCLFPWVSEHRFKHVCYTHTHSCSQADRHQKACFQTMQCIKSSSPRLRRDDITTVTIWTSNTVDETRLKSNLKIKTFPKYIYFFFKKKKKSSKKYYRLF